MKHEALEILKTFSVAEREEFTKFISCKYLNSSQKTKNLFDIIIKFFPDFEGENLSDEFLEKSLNTSDIRGLFRKLKFLLRDFLIHSYTNKMDEVKHIYLLEEFEERKLFGLFEKERTMYLDKYGQSSLEFSNLSLFNKYNFHVAEFNMYGRTVMEHKKRNSPEIVKLQNIMGNSLTAYYIAEVFRSWLEHKWQQDAVQVNLCNEPPLRIYFNEDETTQKFFKAIIDEETNVSVKKALNIYYHIYMIYNDSIERSDKLIYINSLIELLKDLPGNLSYYTKEFVVSVSRNSIHRFVKKFYEFNCKQDEIDDIYLKIFTENGEKRIPELTFSSIFLDTFLDLKFEKARKIFNHYFHYVDNQDLKDLYIKILHLYELFEVGKLENARDMINVLDSEDINKKRMFYVIKSVVLLENHSYDDFTNLISAYIRFLDNHSEHFSSKTIMSSKEFCSDIRLIEDFIHRPSKHAFKKLKLNIKNLNNAYFAKKFKEFESKYV